MQVGKKESEAANRLMAVLRKDPSIKTVSQAEGVAFMLVWAILTEHIANCPQHDIEDLARDQLEAFIEWSRQNMTVCREH